MLIKILKKLLRKRKFFRRRNFKKHTIYLIKTIFNNRYDYKNSITVRFKMMRKMRLLTWYTYYHKKVSVVFKNGNPINNNLLGLRGISLYPKYRDTIYINFTHKTDNIKCTISNHKSRVYQTFSIGDVLKYFKIATSKIFRRNLKGTNLFLNFIRLLLTKRYSGYTPILSIVGFNYNLLILKNQLRDIFLSTVMQNKITNSTNYFLFNLKLNFSKKKGKKIKAIKKRLRKKILLDFVASSHIK